MSRLIFLLKYGAEDKKRKTQNEGLDIGAKPGSQVLASASGKVKFAGKDPQWGNLVVIDHQNGLDSRYGNLKTIKVKVGDKIVLKQVIGILGASALHYEVRVNTIPVNPILYID